MEEICRRINLYHPINRIDSDQHFQTLKSTHNIPSNRGALRSLQHTSFVLAITLAVIAHFTNDHLARFFQAVVGDRNNTPQISIRRNPGTTFVSFSDCNDLPTLAGQVINTRFERLCPTDTGEYAEQKESECSKSSPANPGHDPLQAIGDHALASAINPVTRITQARQDIAMII